MSIQGPGVLFRLRAGGNVAGLALTNATSPTYIQRNGILQSAQANKLRVDWADTNSDGIYETPTYRIEPAATNIMLWSRDCTNIAWSKTTCTAAKTQTGIDGASNSASLLTATAGNGTCLQSVTSAIIARAFTAWVKRSVGTGTVQMTMDNGSTWTTITLTTQYQRFSIPSQTIANPTVGFRIVTNGDAIIVDYMQLESTNMYTTPLATTSGAVTRNTDQCTATFPYRPRALTIYAKYVATDILPGSDLVIAQLGTLSTNPRAYLSLEGGTGKIKMLHVPSVSSVSSSAGSVPTAGQIVEARGVLNSDGSTIAAQSIAGGAEVVGATSGALALAPDWSAHTIAIGSIGNGSNAAPMGLMNLLVLSGVRSLATCQGLI